MAAMPLPGPISQAWVHLQLMFLFLSGASFATHILKEWGFSWAGAGTNFILYDPPIITFSGDEVCTQRSDLAVSVSQSHFATLPHKPAKTVPSQPTNLLLWGIERFYLIFKNTLQRLFITCLHFSYLLFNCYFPGSLVLKTSKMRQG